MKIKKIISSLIILSLIVDTSKYLSFFSVNGQETAPIIVNENIIPANNNPTPLVPSSDNQTTITFTEPDLATNQDLSQTSSTTIQDSQITTVYESGTQWVQIFWSWNTIAEWIQSWDVFTGIATVYDPSTQHFLPINSSEILTGTIIQWTGSDMTGGKIQKFSGEIIPSATVELSQEMIDQIQLLCEGKKRCNALKKAKKLLLKQYLLQQGFEEIQTLKGNHIKGEKALPLDQSEGIIATNTVLENQERTLELNEDTIFTHSGEVFTGILFPPVIQDNTIASEITGTTILEVIKVWSEQSLQLQDDQWNSVSATITLPINPLFASDHLPVYSSQDGIVWEFHGLATTQYINGQTIASFETTHFTFFAVGVATGSFVINNDQSFTTGPNITLQTNISGVTLMKIWNSISERDTTGWTTFETPFAWTLTGSDWFKIVYALFQDGFGNTGAVTDSIFLNTTQLVNPFNLSGITNASLGLVYTSATITLDGINTGNIITGITLNEGTLWKNGINIWTGGSGTLGDQFFISLQAPLSYQTTGQSILTLGNMTGVFTITTRSKVWLFPFNYQWVKVWLRADEWVITSGSNVMTWIDQSGSWRNATQPLDWLQPNYINNILNGNPIIRFNNTPFPRSLDIFTGIKTTLWDIEIFIVSKSTLTGWGNRQRVMTSSGFTIIRPNTTTGIPEAYETIIMNTTYTNNTIQNIRIWANYNNPYIEGLNGDIAEIIIYDRVLNSQERSAIQNHLYTKYFPPTDFLAISGLKLWLKAHDGAILSGGRVTSWLNRAITGSFNAIQTTGSNQPLLVDYAMNGLPVIRFDGNDYLNISGTIRSTPGGSAVFAVHQSQQTGTINFQRIVAGRNSTGNDRTSPGWHIQRGEIPFVYPATISTMAPFFSNNAILDNMRIGDTANDIGTMAFTWDISEILIYDRDLNTNEQNTIQDYLYNKYILNDAIPDPFVFNPITGASINRLYTSNTITITGISNIQIIPIILNTGTLWKNGINIWTGWTWKNGDQYFITLTGATSSNTLISTTLNANGVTGNFDITTTSPINSGIAFWLDATTITGIANDSGITTWFDRSGSGNHMSQSSWILRPLYIQTGLNNLPVVRFDGINDYLSGPIISGNISVFMVLRNTNSPDRAPILGSSTNSCWSDVCFHWGAAASQLLFSTTFTPSQILSGQLWIQGVSRNPSTELRPSQYRLLSLLTTGNTQFNIIGADRPTTQPNRSRSWEFAEIIVYRRVVNNTERISIQNYLFDKWFGGSTAPDPFTFNPITGANANQLYTSNIIILSGLAVGNIIPVTLNTGTLWKNGINIGTGGTGTLGDQFFLGLTSSNINGGSVSSILDANGVNATFTITNASTLPTSGLRLWLDASQTSTLILSGTQVSGWNDRSASGNNAFQTTAANRPLLITWSLNNKNVLRFDGTTDLLQFGNSSSWMAQNIWGLSVFVVHRPSTNAGTRTAFHISDNAVTRSRIRIENATTNYQLFGKRVDGGAWWTTLLTGGLTTNTPAIHLWVIDYTNADGFLYVTRPTDTLFNQNLTFSSAGSTTNTPSLGISIGAFNGGQFFSGDIAEIIVYNRVITTGERNQITNYLVDKYFNDSEPDVFTFTGITGANLNQLYTSNIVTLTGIGSGIIVPVSLLTWTLWKNGINIGTGGTGTNNDQYFITMTSISTFSGLITTTLTAWSTTGNRSILTRPIQSISIIAPTGFTFTGVLVATFNTQTLEQSFTGTHFSVTDPNGINTGWYTTIQSSQLTGPINTISSSNVFLRGTGINLITGITNTGVTLAPGITIYQWLSSPLLYIRRQTWPNNFRTGQYGNLPQLRVVIPSGQSPGLYVGILTFTLYEL